MRHAPANRDFVRPSLLVSSLTALAMVAFCMVDHFHLCRLMWTVQITMDSRMESSPSAVARYAELKGRIYLFTPIADLTTHTLRLPTQANLETMREQNRKLLALFPLANIVAQSAIVATLDGQPETAADRLMRLKTFFRTDAPEWQRQLATISKSRTELSSLAEVLGRQKLQR
jgi:hypothetical protein